MNLIPRIHVQNPIHIAVYFTEASPDGYPFDDPEYRTSYLDFFKYGVQQGRDVNFFVTRGESYSGNGQFLYGERYNPKKNQLEPYNHFFHADIIYNKGDLLTASNEHISANIINHPELNRLCKDKMQSALFFPQYFPVSVEIKNQADVKSALVRIPSAKVVIKPRDGQGGKGVQVLEKSDAEKFIPEKNETYLIQEFLDTSAGVPGITKGLHDLRVTIMNGKIAEVIVRLPQKGKLVSNVSQGGTVIEIEKEELPQDILNITARIDADFEEYFPRIYSIDFGYTASGPRIFELNSQPGLPAPNCTRYYRSWHRDLFETLLSSLQEKETPEKIHSLREKLMSRFSLRNSLS